MRREIIKKMDCVRMLILSRNNVNILFNQSTLINDKVGDNLRFIKNLSEHAIY